MTDTHSEIEVIPHKRRGGQSGNQNALKHGFYSRQFKQQETTDLTRLQPTALQDEILMLRVFMRRIVELSSEAVTLSDNLEIVRVLSLATLSLTRLIRTQLWITNTTDDEWTKALKQSIQEISKEWK